VDAGGASQRVHADTGIVSKDGALDVRAVVKCLLAGVRFERHAIFDAGRKALYGWDGFQRDPPGGRCRAKLAKFTGISGSEKESQ
jgi:hypothetical protein